MNKQELLEAIKDYGRIQQDVKSSQNAPPLCMEVAIRGIKLFSKIETTINDLYINE